jgi:hypothetical protein
MPKKPEAVEILDKQFERKKPVKKTTKKEADKIVKDIKKIEPKKEKISEEIFKPPMVDYEITRTEKFDLNWFLIKSKFVKFEKWISAPYTKKFWEKRGFKQKPPKIKSPDIHKDLEKMVLSPEQLKYLQFYYEDKKRDAELLFRSDK